MGQTDLTDREWLVLKEIINGKSNRDIAKILYISTSTAKAHVGSIFQKLDVSNRVEAAVKGVYLLFLKRLQELKTKNAIEDIKTNLQKFT